jgi:DNA-binding NarL/FixJ family response regulator
VINYGSIDREVIPRSTRIRVRHYRPALIQPPTKKELLLLQHVSEGYRYQDIAREWNATSLQVVKNLAKNVLDKLGADTITHAVAQALRKGLIQ